MTDNIKLRCLEMAYDLAPRYSGVPATKEVIDIARELYDFIIHPQKKVSN